MMCLNSSVSIHSNELDDRYVTGLTSVDANCGSFDLSAPLALVQDNDMFRADLFQLTLTGVPTSSVSGEQEGAAERHTQCFDVKTESSSSETGATQKPDQKLLIAAVDKAAHQRWRRAFLTHSQQGSACIIDEDSADEEADGELPDPEKQAEAQGKQPDALFEDHNDLDVPDEGRKAATQSAGPAHRDTEGQQTSEVLHPPSDAAQTASTGDADSGSPLPEMLKLVLRQSDNKPSAVERKGRLEPAVAAVLTHRCPELLTSIARVRHELYQQSALPAYPLTHVLWCFSASYLRSGATGDCGGSPAFMTCTICPTGRKHQECDLMVAVHHLKMLHAIVLSTDIESRRHSSTEGPSPPTCHSIDEYPSWCFLTSS